MGFFALSYFIAILPLLDEVLQKGTAHHGRDRIADALRDFPQTTFEGLRYDDTERI